MRVLIVDDEPIARTGLRAMLEEIPDVEIVGECATCSEVTHLISRTRPEVILLDIEMPGMSGIEFLRAFDGSTDILVVMITAHDMHAVAAFESDAADYVLKPVTDERLVRAIDRCRSRLDMRRKAHGAAIRQPLPAAPEAGSLCGALADRLELRTFNRVVYAEPSDIVWVEAARYCLRVHLTMQSITVRRTMTEFEKQLDPRLFCRIHRSSIVNLSCVLEVHPDQYGDFEVLLTDGVRLRLSRSRRRHFEMRVGRKL